MERKKRNRIAALLLAVTILVIMLYSAFFVAAEADHDCVGEGCPICYQVDACQNTLKSLSLAVCVTGFCGVAVPLVFLRLFLSSYYNSEVNIIMKKTTALLLALFMLVGALAGCGKQNDTNQTDKLSIVTTIFPEYDWVREILGDKADNAEITMLLDNGVDLHSYQPTADDIVKISDCDLFIYVGGESDEWVEDALRKAPPTGI